MAVYYSGGTITDMFQDLANLGILDSLLPFMIVFTVVYAVFQKAEIFGPGKKNLNVVMALIMGLAVVLPHIMGLEPDVVVIMNKALPQVSLVVIAIIMFLLMVGIFAPKIEWLGTSAQGWFVFVSAIAVAIIFGNSAGWWAMPGFLDFLNDPALQSIILILLVFGIIIWFVTREERTEQNKISGLQHFGEGVANLFGGKPK